jgi:hypothetical protein
MRAGNGKEGIILEWPNLLITSQTDFGSIIISDKKASSKCTIIS